MKPWGLILALMLSACGGGKDEMPEEEGVFDDMTGTLDKAEEVEKQVLEQKERIDRALEEAEQADERGDESDP